MKRNIDNITEEIVRIKSLFGENRLFGNLVEQDEKDKFKGETYGKGSTGVKVKAIQKSLGIEEDGIFGQETEDAVKEFEKNNNLNVDGIVDPKDLMVMLLKYSEK